MPAYVVIRGSLGRHTEGTVVEITDEDEAAGVDLERLLSMEVIRPASEEEAVNAIPVKAHSGRVVPQFPVAESPWTKPAHGRKSGPPEEGEGHRTTVIPGQTDEPETVPPADESPPPTTAKGSRSNKPPAS